MKVVNALVDSMKKTDNTSTEHLTKNRIRSSLEETILTKLTDSSMILEFEALPSALPYVISILEEPLFLERFEFQQVSETLFQVRVREIEL